MQDVIANKEFLVYLIDAGSDMFLPFNTQVSSWFLMTQCCCICEMKFKDANVPEALGHLLGWWYQGQSTSIFSTCFLKQFHFDLIQNICHAQNMYIYIYFYSLPSSDDVRGSRGSLSLVCMMKGMVDMFYPTVGLLSWHRHDWNSRQLGCLSMFV